MYMNENDVLNFHLFDKFIKLALCERDTEWLKSSFEFTLSNSVSLLCIKCLEGLENLKKS